MSRTASSAAIQPPSEKPTRWTRVEIELIEEVEIEVGEVVDGIEPVRRVGLAEARMLRHDHVVPRGESAMNGSQRPAPLGAVQDRAAARRRRRASADVAAADRELGDGVIGHEQKSG